MVLEFVEGRMLHRSVFQDSSTVVYLIWHTGKGRQGWLNDQGPSFLADVKRPCRVLAWRPLHDSDERVRTETRENMHVGWWWTHGVSYGQIDSEDWSMFF